MLVCPKCGYDNELGRIFCHQCGTKLELDKIKATSRGGKIRRRKGAPSIGRILNRVIWIVLLLLVAWGIYSIFQVPEVPPVKSTTAELLGVDNKRLTLGQQLLQKKPGGDGFTMELTAAELNVFISSAAAFGKQTNNVTGMVPTALRAELSDGTVTLNLLGTLKVVGTMPKDVFISYTGVPTVENGHFEFKPVAAAIGRMPIHPKILQSTSVIQNIFARVLKNLGHEKELLDQLTSITVNRGRIVLSYRPPVSGTKPAKP